MDYGNGYRSYSGLTGEVMVEMATGLIMACDEKITGGRVAQVGRVSCFLRQRFDFPIIAGGHALYVAADQVRNSYYTHCVLIQPGNQLTMDSLALATHLRRKMEIQL